MSFEAELKSHLSHSSITALISARLHPDVLPQETVLPAVVFQIIFDNPQTDLDGEDGELSNLRVQLDIWARNRADATPIRNAIRARMKTAASGFKSVPINAGQSFFDPPTKYTRIMMEFSCWWRIT